MILFIAKTWFFWWMFGVVLIVRWFHGLCAGLGDATEDLLSGASSREEAHVVPLQVRRERIFFANERTG